MDAAPEIDQADESTFLNLTPGDWFIALWLLVAAVKVIRFVKGWP